MDEIWKPVKGYEGRYEVSDHGRIKSLFRKGIILKPQTSISGYQMVNLHNYQESAGKTFLVHRLVAENFIPNPFGKREVNHIDGNKTNNAVANLEWVTSSENRYHAYSTGLAVPLKGEDHHESKLTQAQVNEIRSKYVKGSRKNGCVSLAKEYRVSTSRIYQIVKGVAWKN